MEDKKKTEEKEAEEETVFTCDCASCPHSCHGDEEDEK